jgi:hypothetical protein
MKIIIIIFISCVLFISCGVKDDPKYQSQENKKNTKII